MPASTMKGGVLSATGETLATPSPVELVGLFMRSPKVRLDFGKIFEFQEGNANHHQQSQQHRAQTQALDDGEELDSPPPSPSVRKERERRYNTTTTAAPPPTRIRRPSIQTSARSAPARSSGFPLSTTSSSDSSSGHSSAAGPPPTTRTTTTQPRNNPKPSRTHTSVPRDRTSTPSLHMQQCAQRLRQRLDMCRYPRHLCTTLPTRKPPQSNSQAYAVERYKTQFPPVFVEREFVCFIIQQHSVGGSGKHQGEAESEQRAAAARDGCCK
ncbi:hypothetical protein CVT25_014194 [Psilocybe cyanescens]|uniref:Uncharacterized protein n=1 Tax=Psilocybe cyanescens TaxID=93625 RepID=A0A409XG48_PSICY|nr:hypothetical protein CVT25_014194 [Psilocybe cyanescens]